MAAKERKHKIRPLEFIKCYGLIIVAWLTLFTSLGLSHFSLVSCILQTLFLLLWTYYGHAVFHNISTESLIYKINPHIFIHHNPETTVPRWLNLVQESFFNFIVFIIILGTQAALGVHIFSTSIVVAVAMLYVLVHILDYSIFGNKEHTEHHIKEQCNYAPDFMDVLCDSRCEPDAPYYDQNNEIIHTIIAVGITYLLKKHFDWS